MYFIEEAFRINVMFFHSIFPSFIKKNGEFYKPKKFYLKIEIDLPFFYKIEHCLIISSIHAVIISFCRINRYEESESYQKRDNREPKTVQFIVNQLINRNNLHMSTKLTSQIVSWLVFIYGNISSNNKVEK